MLRPHANGRQALAREATIWSRLRHPNVLPLAGFYYDEKEFEYACAVTWFHAQGDMTAYLKSTSPTEAQRLNLVSSQCVPAVSLGFRHLFRFGMLRAPWYISTD